MDTGKVPTLTKMKYTYSQWKGKKIYGLPKNYVDTLEVWSYAENGTDSLKIKRFTRKRGNPLGLKIDSLFFQMYDTTNHIRKLIDPDSLFSRDFKVDSLWYMMYDTTNFIDRVVNPDSLFSYEAILRKEDET